MNPVELILPPFSKVTNHLYESQDIAFLLEDLLIIELPNGIIIDVDWYDEYNPEGHYVIRGYTKDFENEIGKHTTKSLEEVIRVVEKLAAILSLI